MTDTPPPPDPNHGKAHQPTTAWHRLRLKRARSIKDLRAAARARLPRAVFDFADGGADDEVTLTDNSAAFRRIRLNPRVLVDVAAIDMAAPILGAPSKLPFAIAPTGAVGFTWPFGDLALAASAEKAGIPFTLSTTASVSIEHLRARSNGRLWFQCYIFRQRDFTESLIRRAARAGYEALVITVDLPVGGNRERDFRNDFSIPFRYTPRNVADFALHPEWVVTTLRNGTPTFGNLRGYTPAAGSTANAASSVGRNYDASFDWEALARVRDLWPGKLIVKGIVRPDDAERLAGIGADAVVVSNHGGRQLDGAPATIDALPGVKAAAGAMSVLLDGGIRRGSDIVKAIARGADAVLVGRATLYGVAAAGEYGADLALSILTAELKRTMQLCGATRIAAITPDLLRDSP